MAVVREIVDVKAVMEQGVAKLVGTDIFKLVFIGIGIYTDDLYPVRADIIALKLFERSVKEAVYCIDPPAQTGCWCRVFSRDY